VLDCARVDALRLRFPDRRPDDVPLSQGVHAVGRGDDGRLGPVQHREAALVQFCVDRRGVWLQSREGTAGLHVNGRPVRRMAMLRAGDAVHVEGVELTLLGASPRPMPSAVPALRESDRRVVLRGVGGPHHGRCFSLDHSREVGRGPECDVRINEPRIAERHVRLEPHQDGIVLRDLGAADDSIVNGHPVREGLLQAGDQIVFGSQHRFVLEAPLSAGAPWPEPSAPEEPAPEPVAPARSPVARSMRRLPWLLLAALLLAGALTLLLMFGTR
jgi:hypothetical protein